MDENTRQLIIQKNKRDSQIYISELKDLGYQVEWISDLYYKYKDYKNAIPYLIKWLPDIKNKDVKEEMVRALSVSWAKGTSAPLILINEFPKHTNEQGLQWAIGNALSIVADDRVREKTIEYISNKQFGSSRQMLVVSLANMDKSFVEPVLTKLLEEEDLAGHAILALGKIKSRSSLPYIQKFLAHPKTWIRQEAKRAIIKIEKSKKLPDIK